MGSWGYGIQDNDDAADVMELFKRNLEKYSTSESIDRIYTVDWVLKYNASFLQLIDLHIEYNKPVDDYAKKKAQTVLKDEMYKACNWVEPERRRKVLEEFKKRFNDFTGG